MIRYPMPTSITYGSHENVSCFSVQMLFDLAVIIVPRKPRDSTIITVEEPIMSSINDDEVGCFEITVNNEVRVLECSRRPNGS